MSFIGISDRTQGPLIEVFVKIVTHLSETTAVAIWGTPQWDVREEMLIFKILKYHKNASLSIN